MHGREAADRAAETARTTFEEGALAANLPSIEVSQAELKKGLGVLNACVQAGFVKSTGEARRQIKGGGIKVNDETVDDEKRLLTLSDLTPEGAIKRSCRSSPSGMKARDDAAVEVSAPVVDAAVTMDGPTLTPRRQTVRRVRRHRTAYRCHGRQ